MVRLTEPGAAILGCGERQRQLPPQKQTLAAALFMPLAAFTYRKRRILFVQLAPPVLFVGPALNDFRGWFHEIT